MEIFVNLPWEIWLNIIPQLGHCGLRVNKEWYLICLSHILDDPKLYEIAQEEYYPILYQACSHNWFNSVKSLVNNKVTFDRKDYKDLMKCAAINLDDETFRHLYQTIPKPENIDYTKIVQCLAIKGKWDAIETIVKDSVLLDYTVFLFLCGNDKFIEQVKQHCQTYQIEKSLFDEAIDVAIENSCYEILKYLFTQPGVRVKHTHVFRAIKSSSFKCVKLIQSMYRFVSFGFFRVAMINNNYKIFRYFCKIAFDRHNTIITDDRLAYQRLISGACKLNDHRFLRLLLRLDWCDLFDSHSIAVINAFRNSNHKIANLLFLSSKTSGIYIYNMIYRQISTRGDVLRLLSYNKVREHIEPEILSKWSRKFDPEELFQISVASNWLEIVKKLLLLGADPKADDFLARRLALGNQEMLNLLDL